MKLTIELDTGTPGDFEALQRMFAAGAQPPAAPKPEDIISAAPPALLLSDEQIAALRNDAIKLEINASTERIPAGSAVVKAAGGVKPAKPKPKAKVAPAAKKIADRGKAMTQAAKDLGSAVGERAKITRKQKAQIAAKARWAKHKKAAAPAPVKEATQAKQASKPKAPSVSIPKSADKAAQAPKAPKKEHSPKPAKKPPPREAKPHDYSRAEEQSVDSFATAPGQEMRQIGDEGPPPPFPDGRELLEGNFRIPEPQKEQGHERTIEDIARELGSLPDDAADIDAVPGV